MFVICLVHIELNRSFFACVTIQVTTLTRKNSKYFQKLKEIHKQQDIFRSYNFKIKTKIVIFGTIFSR